MRPNGVGVVLAAIVVVSLVPLAADAAVAPPKCWKGKAGCTHTSTPHWNLKTFEGMVSVVGTRQKALSCSDVANGPREEIIAGRYTVKFTLDPKASRSRVGSDAHKEPLTSKPLKLVFDVSATTHEQVRMLAPAGDGNCTESFRDCDKTDTSRASDTLDVFMRNRRVVQETPGNFIKSRFLECAETPTSPSLLPDDPVEGKFMSRSARLSAFRHRDTHTSHGRDHQIGDGSTRIDITGTVTYGRSIRACTRYAFTKQRCRTARG